jgi:hypothetical protein
MSDSKHRKKTDKKLNYNERADGYGLGEAESEHEDLPYEKKREAQKKESEASTKDENGLPNQNGEVDQYSFRDHD